MKILFDNKLLTATLSSLNASPNYPAANLQHAFLKKRWQAIAASDTISMAWASAIEVNCCYCLYTNATAFTLRLYNASGTLLKTVAFTSADYAVHFDAVTGVRSAQLDVSNSGDSVYLGGIGIGSEYAMPSPVNDWADGLTDNSVVSKSVDGQVLANAASPLRTIPFNFYRIGYADYKEAKDLIAAAGLGTPLYVDPFESYHEEFLPLYGNIMNGFENPGKSDNVFSFTLTIQEAR